MAYLDCRIPLAASFKPGFHTAVSDGDDRRCCWDVCVEMETRLVVMSPTATSCPHRLRRDDKSLNVFNF